MSRPSGPLLAFVADQVGVLPESVDEYLIAERNSRRHAAELQDKLQLRLYGTNPAAELMAWLLPQAIEDERFDHPARLIMEECRQRRIVLPWPDTLERLCIEVRHQAKPEVQRRLTTGLRAEQRNCLDALTQRRQERRRVELYYSPNQQPP